MGILGSCHVCSRQVFDDQRFVRVGALIYHTSCWEKVRPKPIQESNPRTRRNT